MTIFKAIITAADIFIMAMLITLYIRKEKPDKVVAAFVVLLLNFNILLIWHTL